MYIIIILISLLISVANGAAPLLTQDASSVIPNSYIIVFKQPTPKESPEGTSSSLNADQALSDYKTWCNEAESFVQTTLSSAIVSDKDSSVSKTRSVYFGAKLFGMHALFPADASTQRGATSMQESIQALLQNSELIEYIEADTVVKAIPIANASDIEELSEVVHGSANDNNITVLTQSNPDNWGLDRIDQRNEPLNREYVYNEKGGNGVTVYVLDTGILLNHIDFQPDRASWGATFVSGAEDRDGNGHGTAVASVVGGVFHGAAKNVSLVAVKVLDDEGSGGVADVIRGVQFAVNDHLSKSSGNNRTKSVVNMSLGASVSRALNDAIDAGTENGVTFVVAAGNEDMNACRTSPASAQTAIAVGATNSVDRFANSFSNYGSCVSILAPGVNITTAGIQSPRASRNITGTSFSSPFVAGVAALYLGLFDDNIPQPNEVKSALIDQSTKGVIDGISFFHRTPNRMLYSQMTPGNNQGEEGGKGKASSSGDVLSVGILQMAMILFVFVLVIL